VYLTIDGEEFTTTEGHPFYTLERGFVKAGELRYSDILVDDEGNKLHLDSKSKEHLVKPVTVYNFAVEDYHTYFVGENEVFVHNTCAGGSFKDVNASKGVNEVGHHLPQNAFMEKIGISRNDGPALLMTKADHMLTRTFAGRGSSTMIRDAGLTARQRMCLDIINIRQNFGTKYNQGLLEAIKYAKTLPGF